MDEIGSRPSPGSRINWHDGSNREPNWLPLDAVVAFNLKEVERRPASRTSCTTSPPLQRALAHPWNVWVYFMDRDIAVLAARLYTSVADARAFAAGNKRTAFRAAVAFVEANGYAFECRRSPTRSTGCSAISTAGSGNRGRRMVPPVDDATLTQPPEKTVCGFVPAALDRSRPPI